MKNRWIDIDACILCIVYSSSEERIVVMVVLMYL
jgi:hypothetical protein